MIDLKKFATFGVAGNFTGHLEQAGEAADFVNVKTKEANAPKAIFPTYIPAKSDKIPEFLSEFPFSSDKIIYPVGQTKVQIEPECAILFKAKWEGEKLVKLIPTEFGASNDCSIRRPNAKKISFKKNWGTDSKGFSSHTIKIDSFDENGIINNYRIACFLIREKNIYSYGKDSAIKNYSYIYSKLIEWMLDKFNNQQDEGPSENINLYLNAAGKPENIFVSIGATRYTEFGEKNFLREGDHSVVILYPGNIYSEDDILKMLENNDLNHDDISVLDQVVIYK